MRKGKDKKQTGKGFPKKQGLKHGLYTQINFRGIDGRTRLGKTISYLEKELYNYVGEINVATKLLIKEIVYKAIRLNRYERANLRNLKNEEAHHFLPLSNSLRLDLVALSQFAGKPKEPNLNDYINAKYGDKKNG